MEKKNQLIKLTDESYFADSAINFSTMKELLGSARNFQYARTTVKEPTASMQLGSAIHCAILEKDVFASEYVACPEIDKRTKEYKEFASANAGKKLYKVSEVEPILETVEKCDYSNGLNLIKSGSCITENAIFWDCGTVNMKCKIDAYDKDTQTLIDVKTTTDVSPTTFQRLIFNNNYHLQLAHYYNGLTSCNLGVNEFLIVAIQTQAPYDVVEYRLSAEVIKEACSIVNKLYDKLENVMLFNDNSGYSTEPITVELPKWYVSNN